MRVELGRLLQTGLIRGKNARALTKDIRKYLIGDKNGAGATYKAERLMRTELARVQTEAQKQSFISNGFEMYTFHANHGCCDICSGLDGKHFKVKDMMPGLNAPPAHPNCRCSVSAYEDSDEYEAWIDYLSKGGTTEQWNKIKYSDVKAKKPLENSAKGSTMRLDDIVIGKSVGAKAKNYEVMDLETGEMFHFVEGTRLQNVEVFAGKGSRKEYRNAYKYANMHGGKAEDWQHVKGFGWIVTPDGDRHAEVHWSQCEGVGKHDFFVKRWLDDES